MISEDYIEIEDSAGRSIDIEVGTSIMGENDYLATLTYSELYDPPITVTTKEDKFVGDVALTAMISAGAVPVVPVTNTPPSVSITTLEPAAPVTGSFPVVYAATDADNNALTITRSISVSPLAASAHYSVSEPANGMVTITQATPDATTMSIPAATVTVTITANDGADSTSAIRSVPFAAVMYTPPPPPLTNIAPVVTITTDAPESAVDAGSFAVEYTATDANSDALTITRSISVSPLAASPHYSVSEPADGMVTITQATADATTMSIPAATVTVTITANDGAASTSAIRSVAFAEAMYTPPPLTNVAPVVTITTDAPESAVDAGSFAVEYTATDANSDALTITRSISVSPLAASAHYSVSEPANDMVTITQATPDATTMSIRRRRSL